MIRGKTFVRMLKFALSFLVFSLGFLITEKGYVQSDEEEYPFLDAGKASSVISMDFKDASLKDILKAFSIQSGVNFIASQDIEDRTVTLYLDEVSVREAMDSLFKANNLDYEYVEEAKIILVKKAEPKIKTITKLFPLKYAHVSLSPLRDEIESSLQEAEQGKGGEGEGEEEEEFGITAVIEKLLSEYGSLIEDVRTNTLIITDLPNRFPVIEQTIKELDISVPQVMLEVEMLDVNKNLVDKLGFDLGNNPFTFIIPDHGGRLTKFFFGDLDKRSAQLNTTGIEGSLVLGSTYAGLLDFLSQETDTKFLARPRILTLNNETAEIKIEKNELIGLEPEFGGEYGSTVTGYETEREITGISLRVTPQINADTGEITMFIRPKVAEASASAIQPETPLQGQTEYQDVEERTTKTLVKVLDGETVIVGGLIHNESNVTINKVPILGDIPIIGTLFRHKHKSKDSERELIVFITPHIIEDASQKLAKEDIEILSSREQDISSKESRLLNIETILNNLNVGRN
jgi:type IV pilus assembly protein PilQ